MNVTFPIIMNGGGHQQFTAPRGVKFLSVINNSDNTLEIYQDLRTALDSNIRDSFMRVSPYSAITLPLTENRLEFTVIYVNGGGVGVKAASLIFSDVNLNINTTFTPVGSNTNVNLTTDSVGLAKGVQLPTSLTPSGNLKTEILNEVPVSVAGTVEVANDVGNPIPVSGTVKATQGTSRALNITAATVVKAAAGRIIRVSVIVAGTAAGSVNDAATTGGAAVANQIASIPNAVGVVYLDFPVNTGIVVSPGAGQTLAISYE